MKVPACPRPERLACVNYIPHILEKPWLLAYPALLGQTPHPAHNQVWATLSPNWRPALAAQLASLSHPHRPWSRIRTRPSSQPSLSAPESPRLQSKPPKAPLAWPTPRRPTPSSKTASWGSPKLPSGLSSCPESPGGKLGAKWAAWAPTAAPGSQLVVRERDEAPSASALACSSPPQSNRGIASWLWSRARMCPEAPVAAPTLLKGHGLPGAYSGPTRSISRIGNALLVPPQPGPPPATWTPATLPIRPGSLGDPTCVLPNPTRPHPLPSWA